MGVLKGGISYSCFYVRGDLPEPLHERFVEAIRMRAFRPLEVEEDDEQRAGWVSIEHPFDLELDHSKVFYGEFLNLGLRIDQWRVPSALFKAHFAEAEAQRLAERSREKLSRREKDELKLFVARRLRRQIVPAMKVVDLSYNLTTGVVRFWSHSAKLKESLQEIFADTFHLDLVPHSPYVAAMRLSPTDAEIKAIEAIEPSVLATEP